MLVQVLPDGEGGVRDFAGRLTEAWAALGMASQQITLSHGLAVERSLAKRVADAVPAGTACAVVLHFSGYGYARRGVCLWLLEELRRLRSERDHGLRVLIVFHELAAAGPPWRSAFWVSFLQKVVLERLARCADVLWTNTPSHARWLHRAIGPTAPAVSLWPVFSNVGEAAEAPRLAQRLPRAVVFGSRPTRARAFATLRSKPGWMTALGIEELVEIGSGDACDGSGLPVHCRRVGAQSSEQVETWLTTSRFGVINYPPHLFGKSGVFAAYAANGCAVINTWPARGAADGLQAGVDFLDAGSDNRVEPECIAQRSWSWYRTHRIEVQARAMLSLVAS